MACFIRVHNVHLQAIQNLKLRWFVYLEEDISCELQYVGSTQSMPQIWANTKKIAMIESPVEQDLRATLKLASLVTMVKTIPTLKLHCWNTCMLQRSNCENIHNNSPGCRCAICEKLKSWEDKWTCCMGTMHHPHGLNARDEIIIKSRCAFWDAANKK